MNYRRPLIRRVRGHRASSEQTVVLWHGLRLKDLRRQRRMWQGAAGNTRAQLHPMTGRVYGSLVREEAEGYAWAHVRRGETGALVRIRGCDPLPDEDWVGNLLNAYRTVETSQFLSKGAERWLRRFPDVWRRWIQRVWWRLPERTARSIDKKLRARGDEVAVQAETGKQVLKALQRTEGGRAVLQAGVDMVLRGEPGFDGSLRGEHRNLSVRAHCVELVEEVAQFRAPRKKVKPRGQRATAALIDGGWADREVYDEETGKSSWQPLNKPLPPWSIQRVPPPRGTVKVTPRIAAWFNRVGYYHYNFPSIADPAKPIWGEGYTRTHGGLYVMADKQGACGSAMEQAADSGRAEADWACWRIRVQPGDYLAVDEDEWNYIQAPYHHEPARQQLKDWGAGASLKEFAAKTRADSMWRAPRAWGEKFVLRWSKPIIDTCVRKGLVQEDQVPNLRVWSAR